MSETPKPLPPMSAMPLRYAELVLALSFVVLLVILIIPVAPIVLDLAITTNIVVAILVLMIVFSAQESLELSTFPAILLFTTLLRLALNVASTRSILMRGDGGGVIQSFGDFVVGGDIIIGMVIFLILIIIQFVVITKGATRVSEVAARFNLDAMPGKQMSIDADLNAGLIDEKQAQARRNKITRESEFYGSMDGATKFVRGDAVAGLFITGINLLGGIIMGTRNGLTINDAIAKYSVLTVGDGLVSQIPALFISIAAGILVTKSSHERVSMDIGYQFVTKPRAFGIAALMTALLGSFPGLPKLPFFTLSAMLAVAWVSLRRRMESAQRSTDIDEPVDVAPPTEVLDAKTMDELLTVDPIRVEIGFGLVPLVDPERGGDLIGHVTNVRRQLASQLGIVVPPIHIRDNLQLASEEYKVLIRGQEMGGGTLRPGWSLALGPVNDPSKKLKGVPTTEPAFGLPAIWIKPEHKIEAEMLNYTVIDCIAVLVTHLTEVLKSHAADILTRDTVQQLLDNFKEKAPAVVQELVPDLLNVGELQKVLQNLLHEKVSIRNLGVILECCADHAAKTKDPQILCEMVRQRLSRSICDDYEDDKGRIHALTLDPKVEQLVHDALASSSEYGAGAIHPEIAQRLLESTSTRVRELSQQGVDVVLLVKASLRRVIAELVLGALPRTAVLSYNEVTAAKKIENVGMITIELEASPA